ncbi:laccase-4 isoform X2 [Ooceraea biroi]|uniref:laccase-4 isoform X2 n=1 Tax=Ooceraea biroi TaxID=2015173 RepID=UPI000F077D58|nr:laccase-4 isoform X2 [Ooceraea biroi]
MHILHQSILLSAILISFGVTSQTNDDFTKEETISMEIPPDDDDVTSVTSASIESSETSSETSSQRKRRIVGGVDDERREIRAVCPLESITPPNDLPNLSSPLECARTCNDREKPKICYYRFVAEIYSSLSAACEYCNPNATNAFCNNCQCVPLDGVERPILTINRMIPGPSIDVCQGDTIVVDVVNNIEGEELAIHWHGILQRGSQYYDGAPFVTQCPISEQSTFRYQFTTDNAGTHFWHAHTGLQKMDGIFGSLIIRQSQKRDVNSYLYDFDLSRHKILVNDWMHELAISRLPGRFHSTKFQDPDSILINGKGRYQDPESAFITDTDLEVFRVRRNYAYRFRMVNAFCTVCSSILTVENHNLTIIAVDGYPVKPTVVTSIISVSGERYDFVINANNRVDSYWIQLRALEPCNVRGIQQLAVLQYDGAPDTPTSVKPIFILPLSEGIVLNPLDSQCDSPRSDAICVNHLQSAIPVDKDIFTKKPDAQIYLSFSFHRYNLQDLFSPNQFNRFLVAPSHRHTSAVMNDILFSFPPSPLLSQMENIPSNTICNSTHKPDNCDNEDICPCTHIIELPYKGIVELIMVDETNVPDKLYHPFHLHGYNFNIMYVGVSDNRTVNSANEVQKLDEIGSLRRRKALPPFKDTIAVPNNGYVVVRFRADNPGYWLLHCHFIYHLATGMANVFHVGTPSDLPPVPHDFPKCGNYLPYPY